MIDIVKKEKNGRTKLEWLDSRHIFSFGQFYDPENTQFGPVRVLNHDIIAPNGGFPKHPHDNMEIVTIVLKGELTHEDSTGTKEVIHTGEVQRMTAGSGIVHSEFNNSDSVPCELLQIWFFPDRKNLEPNYEQKKFDTSRRKNKLFKVVGNEKEKGTIFINQDAELYISEPDSGTELTHTAEEGRGMFIYLINGRLKVNDENLSEGDSAKVISETSVNFKTEEDSSVILFDVPLN